MFSCLPAWSFTKGLVVELFPLVPASCSGRLVGSALFGDPPELGTERTQMIHYKLIIMCFLSWLLIFMRHEWLWTEGPLFRTTRRYGNLIFLFKASFFKKKLYSYFRDSDCEAISKNEGGSWNWQESLCKWHFSTAKQIDWLLNQPLIRKNNSFFPCTIGYL